MPYGTCHNQKTGAPAEDLPRVVARLDQGSGERLEFAQQGPDLLAPESEAGTMVRVRQLNTAPANGRSHPERVRRTGEATTPRSVGSAKKQQLNLKYLTGKCNTVQYHLVRPAPLPSGSRKGSRIGADGHERNGTT